jgi:isoprenylcysteine carboxyl methyltransferase (ICMT) family protein YpbQ
MIIPTNNLFKMRLFCWMNHFNYPP